MNAMPHGSLCWADLMPADQDRAIAFYSGLFGWTIEKGGEQLAGYAQAHLGVPTQASAVAGIFAPMGGPPPPAWMIYLATADIDATLASASEHGGTVVLPAHDVPGSGRFAIVTEPHGAVFGLWQATGHTGFGTFGVPGAFCWAEFYSPDAAATGAFFSAILGLEAQPMDGPPGFIYLQMAVPTNPEGRRIQFGVMQFGEGTSLPADMPPMASGYVAVDDVDAHIERAIELGGTLTMPAMDSGFGRMATITDTEGASLMLIDMAKATGGP